jgi:hypothetical protein
LVRRVLTASTKARPRGEAKLRYYASEQISYVIALSKPGACEQADSRAHTNPHNSSIWQLQSPHPHSSDPTST